MENIEKKQSKFSKLLHYFTTYEWTWLLSLSFFSVLFLFLFPEEETNGISGIIIMILYVIDVVVTLISELLASKQNKWWAALYLIVDATEIAVFLILWTRFAYLASVILFWVPMHIISFINWGKHTDKNKNTYTVVRKLNWKGLLTISIVCLVWTLVVGYLVAAYGPETDFYSSVLIEQIIAYLDACVTALGVANGVLLFFRYKENWLVWLAAVVLETAIVIMSQQWIYLVLQVGYLFNTVYGYIKWTRYIDNNNTKSKKIQLTPQIEENK